ncbi:MAG: hypothetical protein ACYCZL_02225 [Polaromonas sp.]
MATNNKVLEAQADLLAEEALHELGTTPLDEPDEYAQQCNYAGCYPWLEDVICVHPHDSVTPSDIRGNNVADESMDSCC